MDPVLIGEIVAVLMFVCTIGAVLIGYPVAFTLAGVGLIFGVVGHQFGVFDYSLLTGLANRYFGVMINEVLVAVPLFVFMGVVLERSKIAEQLLETMGQLFGSLRGGLGISVVVVGTLLAASTGIVGATVVTMGLLSLPAMMRAGYDPKLASGVICASGTLGQIIPPSTVLIFMGDMLQSANSAAQLAMGNFAPDPVSVGELFAGALIPGVMLSLLYIGWVVVRAVFQPDSCPPLLMTDAERRGLPKRIVVALVPPLLLIFAVLGSILSGIATPTESAAVGAVGAMVLAGLRGQVSIGMLRTVMDSTLRITSMVFVILLGASVFSLVFRGLGGEHLVEDVLRQIPGGEVGAILAVMLTMFVLGFFLDTFEIIFIMVPITAPVLLRMGVDPIWLGVMIGVNLQTSFLTPPFGFALFYLRGVAAKMVSTAAIYRGIVPFVGLQLLAIALLWAFPQMATWLPGQIFGQPGVASAGGAGGGNLQDMLLGFPDGDAGEDGLDPSAAPDGDGGEGSGGFDNLFGPGGGQGGQGSGSFDNLFPPPRSN
jgi:tripartite ATP-independent transporter DctM subunit